MNKEGRQHAETDNTDEHQQLLKSQDTKVERFFSCDDGLRVFDPQEYSDEDVGCRRMYKSNSDQNNDRPGKNISSLMVKSLIGHVRHPIV